MLIDIVMPNYVILRNFQTYVKLIDVAGMLLPIGLWNLHLFMPIGLFIL